MPSRGKTGKMQSERHVQIVEAYERIGMLLAEHPLLNVGRTL